MNLNPSQLSTESVFSFLEDDNSCGSPPFQQDAELLIKESRLMQLLLAINRIKVRMNMGCCRPTHESLFSAM